MTEPDDLGRAEREAEAEAEAAADSATAAAADRGGRTEHGEPEGLTTTDYSLAFTPRNVAVGLAIVAGLVAFAAGRRRRRSRREDG